MSDYDIDGISTGDSNSGGDREVEGVSDTSESDGKSPIRGIGEAVTNSRRSIDSITRPLDPELIGIDIGDSIESSNEDLQKLLEVNAKLLQANLDSFQVDINRRRQISEKTTRVGKSEAAILELGNFRRKFEINYDIDVQTTVFVEASLDGEEWYYYDELLLGSNNDTVKVGKDIGQGETSKNYVRAYVKDGVDSSKFTHILLASKG